MGDALKDLMAARGWPGADAWAAGAQAPAPTVSGGSKKHGGPDLGPAQTKAAAARLGVNGFGITDEAPGPGGLEPRATFTEPQRAALGDAMPAAGAAPMLTVAMGARLQGFPGSWQFSGGKSAQWRQIGNAFPPPAARALGLAIAAALEAAS